MIISQSRGSSRSFTTVVAHHIITKYLMSIILAYCTVLGCPRCRHAMILKSSINYHWHEGWQGPYEVLQLKVPPHYTNVMMIHHIYVGKYYCWGGLAWTRQGNDFCWKNQYIMISYNYTSFYIVFHFVVGLSGKRGISILHLIISGSDHRGRYAFVTTSLEYHLRVP